MYLLDAKFYATLWGFTVLKEFTRRKSVTHEKQDPTVYSQALAECKKVRLVRAR